MLLVIGLVLKLTIRPKLILGPNANNKVSNDTLLIFVRYLEIYLKIFHRISCDYFMRNVVFLITKIELMVFVFLTLMFENTVLGDNKKDFSLSNYNEFKRDVNSMSIVVVEEELDHSDGVVINHQCEINEYLISEPNRDLYTIDYKHSRLVDVKSIGSLNVEFALNSSEDFIIPFMPSVYIDRHFVPPIFTTTSSNRPIQKAKYYSRAHPDRLNTSVEISWEGSRIVKVEILLPRGRRTINFPEDFYPTLSIGIGKIKKFSTTYMVSKSTIIGNDEIESFAEFPSLGEDVTVTLCRSLSKRFKKPKNLSKWLYRIQCYSK